MFRSKAAGESTALTSLFSYSDLDNDIISFAVRDRELGGGFLTKKIGRASCRERVYKSSIGEIGQWTFVAGPAGSTSTIGFNAIDSRGVYSLPSAFSTVSVAAVSA